LKVGDGSWSGGACSRAIRGRLPNLRETLRAATADIHSQLHLHAGFAAIQQGTIDLAGYRALLVRLYGFHVSFEAAMGMANDRSA